MNIPPEVLVIRARELEPDYHAKIQRPSWDEPHAPDWRNYVAPTARKVWDIVDYGMRLMLFVNAAENAAERARRRAARGEP